MKVKFAATIVLAIAVLSVIPVVAGTRSWNHMWGVDGREPIEVGIRVGVDEGGNAYMVGQFSRWEGVEPDFRFVTRAFITKFDGDGNHLWSKSYEIWGKETAIDIAVGVNLYMVGEYERGIFIAKFDRDGNHITSKALVSAALEERYTPSAITLDDGGDIYIVGTISVQNKERGILIAKLDGDLSLLWAKKWVSGGYDKGFDIIVNGGGLYVVGYTTSAGPPYNPIVLKFDTDGNLKWKTKLHVNSRDLSIALDHTGDVLVAGGDDDKGLLVKLDPKDGQLEGAMTISYEGYTLTSIKSVAVDNYGNTFLVGKSLMGKPDVTILKIDKDWNTVWSIRWGDEDKDEEPYDLALGASCYIVGETNTISKTLNSIKRVVKDVTLDQSEPPTDPSPITVSINDLNPRINDLSPRIDDVEEYDAFILYLRIDDPDADDERDLFIWRPNNGYWYVLSSSTDYDYSEAFIKQWGLGALEDQPLIGYIDSDGLEDLIIWRPNNGYWYVLKSSTLYDYRSAFIKQWGSGALDDKPLIGDIDGDGLGDLIVWRPGDGRWYVLKSSTGYSYSEAFSKQWGSGALDDKPLIGDVDGDGKDDLIIWRPTNGYWYILKSSTGYDYSQAFIKQWGSGALNDIPLVDDFDGDCKDDLIIWRPGNGYWYILKSSANYDYGSAFVKQWGSGTLDDVPLTGDLDGDGKADLIIWRPGNGIWYVLRSSTNYDYSQAFIKQWGTDGDVPR